ncbi:MAG TPA: hypothetical protein RMH99_13590 [Sandaracinaceae bacterium LLY-WYZ-13_1]|nr:hypothetical protein [Sandaracinaceae bacterium LLY-WYZ-13_1]
MGATRAATPSARREQPGRAPVSVGASIQIPRKRLPLLGAIGCGLGILVGAVVAGVWLFSDDDDAAQAATEEPVAPETAEEDGSPEEPPAPARPAARDPFAEALPAPLAAIHARAERLGGERISRSQLSEISQYQREHPDDPRPHLMLGHIYTDRRWLQFALPEYLQAYEMDPTVRGDPAMLPDLLEMVRSNQHERAAGDLVVRAYGEDALDAIDAAIEERMRDEERDHLESLRDRIRGR